MLPTDITLLAVDIEKEITISGTGEGTQVEEWLEVGNGCTFPGLFDCQILLTHLKASAAP